MIVQCNVVSPEIIYRQTTRNCRYVCNNDNNKKETTGLRVGIWRGSREDSWEKGGRKVKGGSDIIL